MQTPILQFGTSRFLQAHALSYFQSGAPLGATPLVTVVQSTADPARRARLDALSAPGGYPVRVRGIESGQHVDREERVTLVRRGLSYDRDYAQIARIFSYETRWVISNTADRGFDPQPADALPRPDPAQSYPAKLFHLMRARHLAGGAPLVVLPTELVPRNGDKLRARVGEIAAAQGAEPALLRALDGHVWANSLVDRIVSQDIAPAGAVAEPYGLWAIEAQPGLVLPVLHPALQIVQDLKQVERLKLHILNLGHSVMVDLWQRAGRHETFVREVMRGPLRATLMDILDREVLPGFAARGMADQARDYMAITIERFENPFLDHRLSDISQNHAAKIGHRITAFLDWSRRSMTEAPRLHAISQSARDFTP
jgi:tagaturonate reductase